MKLIYKALRHFSLDHSILSKSVTTTGLKNYTIFGKNKIQGYLTNTYNTNHQQKQIVIMIHQWWGLNQSITQTAQILSTENIQVFVPDLYRGEAANTAEEAGHKMTNLNWPQALQELTEIKKHFEEKEKKSVNIVGFCMGGALTFAALSSIPGWRTGAPFYGIPDLNIFPLKRIKAKVVALFATEDPLKGFSDQETVQKIRFDCQQIDMWQINLEHVYQLKKLPITFLSYHGANHAFCNQDSVYFDERARDAAFHRVRRLIELQKYELF